MTGLNQMNLQLRKNYSGTYSIMKDGYEMYSSRDFHDVNEVWNHLLKYGLEDHVLEEISITYRTIEEQMNEKL